ncbi:FAD-binding oxidoreductase [Candidatus Marsarchaeota archaeon]|nr:FAD-binding oxidoreductase [Candidatus Marsarchaeota archaeon]
MILNRPYVLKKIKKSTPEVSAFTFEAQDGTSIDFVPGMFAMLYYKNQETGESIGRAFSIANAPPSQSLEFLISLVHGKFTSKLDTAKIGDVYYISAPYGQFKFDLNSGTKFLFLAGGTGLAPFFSMLRLSKARSQQIDGVLIYSTKYSDDIIEQEELSQITSELGVKLAVTVTRPKENDTWKGDTGHVNAEMIKKYAPDVVDRVSYICGPPAFVNALKQALFSLGVDQKHIKAEMWG